MKVKYPYIVQRHSYFYFRITVPRRLVQLFQRKELVYTLSTQSLVEAQARSLIFHQAALLLFGRVSNMSQVSPEAFQKGIKQYFYNVIKRQKIMVQAIEDRMKVGSSPCGFNLEAELLRQDYFFKDQFLFEGTSEDLASTSIFLDKEGIYEVTPEQVAIQIISETDLPIAPNTIDYIALKRRVPDLITHANKEYQKLVAGDWDIASCIGTSFEEHWPQYIEEMERSGLQAQTIKDKKATFEKWKELMGSVPLSSLNKKTTRKFKEYLCKLPSNASKKHPKMTLKELLELDVPMKERMKPRTIKGYLSDMRSYVTWLKGHNLFENDNPFDGISMADT